MITHLTKIILYFIFITFATSQNESDNKKRKVYRTQTGSIIEAPKPLFERKVIKRKKRLKITVKK